MIGAEWWTAKSHAVRTLYRMARWLENWPEVWSAYRLGRAVPPLRYRAGFTIHHGPGDDPVMLLHEVFAERCYTRYMDVPPSGTVIDIGANIGSVSLGWAAGAPGLRIHAYEPDPRTSAVLRRNIDSSRLSDRITMYAEAVGGDTGELRFWTNVPSVLAGAYGAAPPAPEAVEIRVPMVDLNEVVHRTGAESIEVLKIDTEGAEADILSGATPATLRVVKRVVLEYHDHLRPNALASCQAVLEDAGFQCRVVPGTPEQGMLYARKPSA